MVESEPHNPRPVPIIYSVAAVAVLGRSVAVTAPPLPSPCICMPPVGRVCDTAFPDVSAWARHLRSFCFTP